MGIPPKTPQPPIAEIKLEIGINPTTGMTELVGIIGTMGLVGVAALFTRNK